MIGFLCLKFSLITTNKQTNKQQQQKKRGEVFIHESVGNPRLNRQA